YLTVIRTNALNRLIPRCSNGLQPTTYTHLRRLPQWATKRRRPRTFRGRQSSRHGGKETAADQLWHRIAAKPSPRKLPRRTLTASNRTILRPRPGALS